MLFDAPVRLDLQADVAIDRVRVRGIGCIEDGPVPGMEAPPEWLVSLEHEEGLRIEPGGQHCHHLPPAELETAPIVEGATRSQHRTSPGAGKGGPGGVVDGDRGGNDEHSHVANPALASGRTGPVSCRPASR